jgi:hypothetical protein
VEISNRFLALNNLYEILDIKSVWESIKDIIKTSAKDNQDYDNVKCNKPQYDDECSKVIDQRKQAKLQWLQNPSQTMAIICKI